MLSTSLAKMVPTVKEYFVSLSLLSPPVFLNLLVSEDTETVLRKQTLKKIKTLK